MNYRAPSRHYALVHSESSERRVSHSADARDIGPILVNTPTGRFLTGEYCRDLTLRDSARAGRIRAHRLSERGFAILEYMDEVGRDLAHGVLRATVARPLADTPIAASTVGAYGVQQLCGMLAAVELPSGGQRMEAPGCLGGWQSQ